RQPKIEYFGVASVSHEYVGWLDVSVDDSLGVRGIESISDFDAEIQERLHLHGTTRNAVLQRRTLQILHGNERLPPRFANVINGADVGMVQGRRCLCLSLKTRQCLSVFREIVG